MITGTVLLTFASSWALLATLSTLWTEAAPAMGGPARRLHGVGRRRSSRFAPSGTVIDALGWVWPPLLLALIARRSFASSRICTVAPGPGSCTRCWAYTRSARLAAAIKPSESRSTAACMCAPGQLVDVGGHRLHLNCAGSGTPTVILESGLGESAAYWGWISAAVARDTKVCVYDRAGRGWSDPASAAQDGVAVATDLHILLDRGHVTGPFVLVGHSSGAQYVRIFAGRYPEQVAGMVLLDGQPAEAFESLPDFPAFYDGFRRVSALLPSLARLGVGRLVFHADFVSLPAQARDMQRLNHASARLYRSLRDEFAELPTSLAQAAFVSEPRRPTAGRRDRCAGRASGMAAVAGQDGDAVHEQQPPRRALHT